MRALGVTRARLSRQRTLTKAKVRPGDTGIRRRGDARTTACHELMHAITMIRDNVGAAPTISCVWGLRPTPERRDAVFAATVYARDRDRTRRGSPRGRH
jgi:hypothetical protein